jgi:hypothetical protein
MIESRSQAGQRRRMTLSQSPTQSSSILSGGAESAINRIVAHWGSAHPALTFPRSGPEAELLPPEEKIQLKENNASHLKVLGV